MKTRTIKKLIVAIVAFVMMLSGAIYIGTNADEVKAEDSAAATLETGAVVLAADNVTNGTVPTANITTYADYLFAGWFKDTACTQAVSATEKAAGVSTYYAKFVPADTLSVKIQISNNTITDEANGVSEKRVIRFISSVESLDLSQVGFVIDGMNGNEPYYNSTVYERIDSSLSDELDYEFSPKVVGTKAEYFITAKLPVATDADSLAKTYTVKACWETLDGTVVTGDSRCVSVNDKANNIINFTVKGDELTVGGSYTATFTSGSITGENATVTVLNSENGYSNVRIALPTGTNVVNMKSATSIEISGTDGKSASGIFRNYYTTYAGTADTSWYDVNPDAKEFVIASSADLYGVANVVNSGKPLTSQNVILVRDIEINEGTASESGWTPDGNDEPYGWIKIGYKSGIVFDGTFDGDGNSISGIVFEHATNEEGAEEGYYSGVFGYTGGNSLIKDFKLENSYFNASYNTGAIVGTCVGDLEDLYVGEKVYVKNNVTKNEPNTGGIAGYANVAISIKNCWFNGHVITSRTCSGGIIARIRGKQQTLENCLSTGTITNTGTGETSVGGLIGQIDDASSNITIENCLATSKLIVSGTGKIAPVIGFIKEGAIVSFVNTYAVENITSDTTIATYAMDGVGSESLEDATINGKTIMLDSTEVLGEKGYINTEFDFCSNVNEEGLWLATAEGPELAKFSTKKVDDTLVDAQRVNLGWYYNHYVNNAMPDNQTYTLYTSGDLYGFASISKATDAFAGDIVRLGADIVVNEGKATDIGWSTENPITWTSIAAGNQSFAGVFDGQEHSISGLYMKGENGKTTWAGLFGYTAQGSVVKNVRLLNSYFQSTGFSNSPCRFGSIAGELRGELDNVYSNAVVRVDGNYAGGLVGNAVIYDATYTEGTNIKNCWFDGKLFVLGSATRCGGIAGAINTSSTTDAEDIINLTNCLNTGYIYCERASWAFDPDDDTVGAGMLVGGFVGADHKATTINMTNCLFAGTMEVNYSTYANTYIGKLSTTGSKLNATNCYHLEGTFTEVDVNKVRENIYIIDEGGKNTFTGEITPVSAVTEATGLLSHTDWMTTTNGTPIPNVFNSLYSKGLTSLQ